ncbi:uncharacterized protein KZ484_022157 isoform 2-T2 [Pholidichthys leucotaenia]
MLMMDADKWIFLLVLCFMSVSSNDDLPTDDSCDLVESNIYGILGETAFLPCDFANTNIIKVSWVHNLAPVVNFSDKGKIKFLDPRHGRVKAFPIQHTEKNYSIRIDELRKSDLGCYHCEATGYFLQVRLHEKGSTFKEDGWSLILVCLGGVALLLLFCFVCYYICKECIKFKNQDSENSTTTPAVSAPPMESGTMPAAQTGAGSNNIVYENNDQCIANMHSTRNPGAIPGVVGYPGGSQPNQSSSGIYPNLNQFQFERVESQRTRQRFHLELFSRLRQASFSRQYYVNQHELSKQQATPVQENQPRGHKKKKAKENSNYNNPIYNRSTDQLNKL